MTALTPYRLALCTAIAESVRTSIVDDGMPAPDMRSNVLALLQDCPASSDYTEVLVHLHKLLPADELAARAQQYLDDELAEAVELDFDDENQVRGHLMALPLLLSTPGLPLHSPPTPELLKRLPALLVEQGFVALAEDITVLPLLLGTQETGCMTHAEVLQLRLLLAQGDVAAAEAFQLSVRDKLYPGWRDIPESTEPVGSLGLVIAYVRSAELDPFDLARDLDQPGDEELGGDPELRQALKDTAAELEALSEWTHVLVPEGADWWYTATASAQNLDRLMNAEATVEHVRDLCRLEVGEVLAGHQVDDLPETELPGLEMVLSRSRDGTVVGKLVWPQLRFESPDECLESFYEFLFDSDIVPVESLAMDAPAAGTTLH